MRTRNWRLVVTGLVMVVLAGGFFLYMGSMSESSDDPAELMRTVGQVSGIVTVLAVAVILAGLVGSRA